MKPARILFIAIIVAAAIAALTVQAWAGPVAYGSNLYEYVQVGTPGSVYAPTWAEASAAAALKGGHLATVTSAGENAFLVSLTTSYGYTGFVGAWLGGKSRGNNSEVEWVEGPDAGVTSVYTNWTDYNNSGFYMYMSIGTDYEAGKWIDDSGTNGSPQYCDPVIGYFIEYENAAVPEPGLMILLGIALAAVAGLGLKKSF